MGKSRASDANKMLKREFQWWHVDSFSHWDEHYCDFWNCTCRCGTKRVVSGSRLRTGRAISCGCQKIEMLSTKKGMSRTRTYRAWAGMIRRCTNGNDVMWHRYGGRGISVCERWLRSFDAFIEDMGVAPDGDYSIDRIDSDGDYCKANCRWATRKEQNRNTCKNRFIEYNGETLPLAEWAERLGVDRCLLKGRLERGWTVADAFETPARPRRHLLTMNGQTKSVSEWSRELGITTATIFYRIRAGKSDAECLSTEGYRG